MGRRLLFFLPLAVFAVVAGYFLWGLDPERNPREVRSALIDKPVPDFALPPVPETETPGLDTAHLSGEVTLVNFFASWCIPCRAEHPLLMELAEDPSIRLVGINYRDPPPAGARWLASLGNPYRRIGLDDKGRTAIDWGVSGVPETFIIDREGRIRHQHIGPIHPRQLEEEIIPVLEALKG
ncbi:MAG: DsbE family thiol:disulfide interchange protein [Kiloniellales bacterium]|nr:DsbE family thiol:disulfide interchange protein [Kiloniellales bacterium]